MVYLVQLIRMARCIVARQDLPACSRGWGPKSSRRTVQMRQGGGCGTCCRPTASGSPHTEHVPLLLLAQAGPRAAAQHARQQAWGCIPILAHLKAAAQRRQPVTNSSGGACSARCTRSGRSCRGLAAMHSNHSHAGQTVACTSGERWGVQACDVAAPAGLAAKQRQLQRAQARSLRGAAAPLAATALVACLVRQYRRAQCMYCPTPRPHLGQLFHAAIASPGDGAVLVRHRHRHDFVCTAGRGGAALERMAYHRQSRTHACMHMHAAATGMQHQRRSEAQRPVRQHAAATRASPAWVHRGRHFLIKPTL